MKRIIILLFAFWMAISVSGCKASSDNHTLQDYNDTTENITGSFTVGNFVMTIPEGYSAKKSSDLYMLFSENSDCIISVFAVDLSILDETHVRQYVSTQSKVYEDPEATIYNAKVQELAFGDLSVRVALYAEETVDGRATIRANGSFTDSWYGYTVAIQCSADSDRISEDFYSFAEFCGYAEYIGEDRRFDFIQ